MFGLHLYCTLQETRAKHSNKTRQEDLFLIIRIILGRTEFHSGDIQFKGVLRSFTKRSTNRFLLRFGKCLGGPGGGFGAPGGGFLVLVAVVACHHSYYH